MTALLVRMAQCATVVELVPRVGNVGPIRQHPLARAATGGAPLDVIVPGALTGLERLISHGAGADIG